MQDTTLGTQEVWLKIIILVINLHTASLFALPLESMKKKIQHITFCYFNKKCFEMGCFSIFILSNHKIKLTD